MLLEVDNHLDLEFLLVRLFVNLLIRFLDLDLQPPFAKPRRAEGGSGANKSLPVERAKEPVFDNVCLRERRVDSSELVEHVFGVEDAHSHVVRVVVDERLQPTFDEELGEDALVGVAEGDGRVLVLLRVEDHLELAEASRRAVETRILAGLREV